MHVASTSVWNCFLIFENVSSSEGACIIFDFPVILEFIQLLVSYEFSLHLILDLCSKALT